MADKQKRTGRDSLISDPHVKGPGRGVKIISTHTEGEGARSVSKHEPDKLQTEIQVGAGDTQPLGPDGRRQYR